MAAGLFFVRKVKKSGTRTPWNSRRWFLAMGKIELIDTGRLTEKQARLNMEKCAEFLARMIQKYGGCGSGGRLRREMHSCRGSDRVCRWSLGLPVFLRYGNRIGEGGFLGQFFWSFCELAQTG